MARRIPAQTVGLEIFVKNTSGQPIVGLTGELAVSFGGTTVTTTNPGPLDYPSPLDANAIAANAPYFTVPIQQGYSCGGRLSLHLTLRSGSGGNLLADLYAPLTIGKFNGGSYEDSTAVANAESQDAIVLPRGDGFALFYLATDTEPAELRYQQIGPYGEPRRTETSVRFRSHQRMHRRMLSRRRSPRASMGCRRATAS